MLNVVMLSVKVPLIKFLASSMMEMELLGLRKKLCEDQKIFLVYRP
jgi:hypothetical protein